MNNYLQFIFKDDLVKIILKIIGKKITETDVFNVANNKIRIKDFYKKLGKIQKIKKIKKNFSFNNTFPLPTNILMNCGKVKKKIRIRFSSINRGLSLIC